LRNQGSAALEVWVKLLRGHAALRRLINVQLQGDHGLTVNDFEALLLLSRADDGQLRRVDLAERLQLTPSGVTRLLDGLEELGLVAKGACASDARVSYAVITEVGLKRLKEASAGHTAAIREICDERYSEAELKQLSELLGRLPGAADANGEECSAPSGPEERSD
jgi:DNA-binding MarR family transcriptional regulator